MRQMRSEVDQTARRKLIQEAISILDEGNRLLVVSLDDFFEGNTDEQSIGVNLPADKHIGLAGFRSILQLIRQRPNVEEVFIELTEIPDPDEEADADLWPVACVAFIVTSANLNDVKTWVAPFHPRDVAEGWNVQSRVKTPLLRNEGDSEMRPVRVWLL
jgi:hypothetical protein